MTKAQVGTGAPMRVRRLPRQTRVEGEIDSWLKRHIGIGLERDEISGHEINVAGVAQ